MSTSQGTKEPVPDPARIEDAVLALLWLTAVTERKAKFKETWAWKGHDWEALGRLHEKGFITDPVGKAKRVYFTEEGMERSKALFEKLFCTPAPTDGQPAPSGNMSTPPSLTADAIYAAAEHLTQTEKGREALLGLEAFFDRGMSLDAGNARACLTLLEGFFGAWTGSAVDAVRESAAKTG